MDVLTSSKLVDALDLSKEDPRIVARYGDGKPYKFIKLAADITARVEAMDAEVAKAAEARAYQVLDENEVGGLFVSCSMLPNVGAPVKLTLQLDSGQGPLDLFVDTDRAQRCARSGQVS